MTTIQMRRGTASEWTSAGPTLAAGEIGFENDTYKIKIGDGSTAWASLAYFNQGFTAGYTAKTASYTLVASDYTVECTANSFTATLPTAVGVAGQVYVIKNTGSGTITVATTSGQTIDGESDATLTQYDSLTVQSNETAFKPTPVGRTYVQTRIVNPHSAV